MKKLICSLLILSSILTTAIGQIEMGVKTSIGVTLAPNEMTASGEPFDMINHEVTYKGSNFVKSIGVYGQQKFGFLYGRAELAYTNYKQEFDVKSFVQFGQGSKTVYEKYDFIDFQLMAGVTHNNIRLGVGPVAHILVGHEAALDFISGYTEDLRTLTYGFTTAVGVDAGRFNIDVRYENNFKTVGQHIFYGDRKSGFTASPHVVNVTVGFRI